MGGGGGEDVLFGMFSPTFAVLFIMMMHFLHDCYLVLNKYCSQHF